MLYWINHSQDQFVYAYKDLSFLGFDRSVVCQQCNRTIVYPQYSTDAPHLCLEGTDNYPDYLQFTGAGRQIYIVSERTLELYEKNKISGYSGYYLLDVIPEAKRNSVVEIPRYYSLCITGTVDLDFAAMYLKKKKVCKQCGQFEWNRMRMHPMFLDLSTWDGSDLCSLRTFPGLKLCSPRAKELMVANHLMGFSFISAV